MSVTILWRKALLILAVALMLAAWAMLILTNSLPADRNRPAPLPHPLMAHVYINLQSPSGDFGSSTLVTGLTQSMLVLPLGGNGTIPFTVSSDSSDTFNGSLSLCFGAQGT